MPVRQVDPWNIDQRVIAEAAAVIQRGGLVAFPTETVYGLGADATNVTAVDRIFTAKGRPSYNPLIVHVHDVTVASACVARWPSAAAALAARFWPGPLTLVLPKQPIIPGNVTAGLDTVAIRIPAHPVALALLRESGRPIAAPSANRSMQVSPTDGRHVSAVLGDAVDLILDAGPVAVGIESTVLDLSGAVPTILRPGMISRADLAEVIGEVRTASAGSEADSAKRSPGMMDRHYSPRTRLVIAGDAGGRALDVAVSREARSGLRAVVLARTDYQTRGCTVRQMPITPSDYARALYAVLHQIDADGFDVAIVEPVPADDAWAGVRDRLTRAAR